MTRKGSQVEIRVRRYAPAHGRYVTYGWRRASVLEVLDGELVVRYEDTGEHDVVATGRGRYRRPSDG